MDQEQPVPQDTLILGNHEAWPDIVPVKVVKRSPNFNSATKNKLSMFHSTKESERERKKTKERERENR